MIAEDRYAYCGDTNIEQGGLFYLLTDDNISYALEVRPLSSTPEDDGWRVIYDGHIFVRDDLKSVLDTCGYELVSESPLRIQDCTGAISEGIDALRMRIEAAHAYGGIEDGSEIIVFPEDLTNGLASYLIDLEPLTRNAIGAPSSFQQPDPEPGF